MKIKINDIESYRSPESCAFHVDDRIEKIQLINGNCVQDYGHVESGDFFTVSALFTWDDFARIVTLWEARTPVTFTDENGLQWQGCRVVLRGYKYLPRFRNYVTVDLEIWRC